MTKEQHINETELTEKLVDYIISFNSQKPLDEIDDPENLSEAEIAEIYDRYEKNFIRKVQESFSKVKKITDIELAFRLILETDIDIYNKAIETHLAQICSQENIQALEEKSRKPEYQGRTELLRIESLRPERERETLIKKILAGSDTSKPQITR